MQLYLASVPYAYYTDVLFTTKTSTSQEYMYKIRLLHIGISFPNSSYNFSYIIRLSWHFKTLTIILFNIIFTF